MDKKVIILLILAAACFFLSAGHIANIYLDIGREVYYPQAVLNGKILYKDLFCIYGPVSYFINAAGYALFGAKLETLYTFGAVCGTSIILLVFILAKKFLCGRLAFITAVFLTAAGALSARIFNLSLPYSYAILYGLLFFLLSVWFVIIHDENKRGGMLHLAAIFAGLAAASKYDFLLYAIPFTIYLIRIKNLRPLLTFGLAFVLPFLVLFLQGLSFLDLYKTAVLIKSFANSPVMKDFYTTQGVYYTPLLWKDWSCKILLNLIYFSFISAGINIFKKRKYTGAALVCIGAIPAFLFARPDSYLFLTFITSALFIFSFKKNSFMENFFIFSCLTISLKSLWGLSHANYGLYFVSPVMISFLIMLKNEKVKNAAAILFLSYALNFGIINIKQLDLYKTPVAAENGVIFTSPGMAKNANGILRFLDGKQASLLVLPEGLILNFLSKKTAPVFYNSLIPLYTETFSQEAIIENFKENPVDYFVVTDISGESYRRGAICDDYGFSICKYIFENYNPVKNINGTIILEKKNF